MEIKVSDQKVSVQSHKRSTLSTHLTILKIKKLNQIITARIVKTDSKGLVVKPEGLRNEFSY